MIENTAKYLLSIIPTHKERKLNLELYNSLSTYGFKDEQLDRIFRKFIVIVIEENEIRLDGGLKLEDV